MQYVKQKKCSLIYINNNSSKKIIRFFNDIIFFKKIDAIRMVQTEIDCHAEQVRLAMPNILLIYMPYGQ